MGSVLSPEQEDLIAAHAKQIVLMLDQDEAGKKGAEDILFRLARRVYVKVLELPSEGDQPDKLKDEELVRFLKEI